MYRVIAIAIGGLALAACSSTPDWMNLDALKPKPVMDTVRFESEPPGAEAKTNSGQTCRTPCALALAPTAPVTVVFTLNGYQPESADIQIVNDTNGASELRPNPVQVELTPAPPPPKPVKKPVVRKKKTATKPAASAKPKTAAKPKTVAKPAPAATSTAAPAQQQQTSPWPAAPPPKQQ